MKANFHTHTKRCGHASGEDREYVEAAIAAGMDTLGFSDHAVFDYPNGYVSPWRGGFETYGEYVDSINALKAEYADRIRIFVGWEMEYHPALFDAALEQARQHGIDYLLLTHHAYGNEYDVWSEQHGAPRHACFETDRNEDAVAYVDNLMQAMEYGVFSYIAHPDILCFVGDEAVYRREMRRLCEAAKAHDLPLEINLSGLRKETYFPSERFFSIAKDVGNTCIFGMDAHTPDALLRNDLIERGKQFAARIGLTLTEEIRLPLKQTR